MMIHLYSASPSYYPCKRAHEDSFVLWDYHRPVLLGAYKVCPSLRSELEKLNADLWTSEKSKEASPPTVDCSFCPSLLADLDELCVEKTNLENGADMLDRKGWVTLPLWHSRDTHGVRHGSYDTIGVVAPLHGGARRADNIVALTTFWSVN